MIVKNESHYQIYANPLFFATGITSSLSLSEHSISVFFSFLFDFGDLFLDVALADAFVAALIVVALLFSVFSFWWLTVEGDLYMVFGIKEFMRS
jgi:hypothetical protein